MTEEEQAAEAPPAEEAPAEEAPVEEAPAEDEDRDPMGTWRVISNPKSIQTSEGVDASITVELGHGDILNKPRVLWIKGKWNEITKGDRYDMTHTSGAKTISHTLTFKAPKMTDCGLYTLRIISKNESVDDTFNLKVGPYVDAGNKIVIGKGRRASMAKVVEMEIDFRARLKKVKKKESEGGGVSGEVWNVLKKANPREYEKISFNYGISDLRGMLKRLGNTKKNNKKGNMFSMRLNDTAAFMVGDKLVLECETMNETMSVRWFQNGREVTGSKRVSCKTEGNLRTLTIDSCLITDDSQFACQCQDEKTCCEVFVRDVPGKVEVGFEDLVVTDGEEAVFTATLSSETAKYRILRDGVELARSEKVRIKKNGKVVTLTLPMAQLDDAGFYQIQTNGGDSFAELIVEEKQVEFKSGFSDLSVNFNESAEFKCEVSERDAVGKWFKDGKEVEPSDRIEIRDIGCIRKICINNVTAEDQGEYEYRVEGKTPVKLSACLEAVEIIVEKPKEPPKIFLAKSENKEMIVKVGGKVALDFGISGDPAPKVEWLKDGAELFEDGKRLQLVADNDKSSMQINNAKRVDTGKYTLRVTSEAGEDNFDIVIKVIDVPSMPGTPIISDLNDESCRTDWTPPQDDGDCEMRGYIIERKKVKAQRWIRLNGELCGYHNYDVRRLVDGNTYQVRVTPVNICGPGEPSEPSEPFTPIAPTSEVTSFRLGRQTDESIELHWRQPAEVGAAGIDGYKVQMQIIPGAMGKAKAEDAREDAWTDARDKLLDARTIKINLDALDTGKNYYFRICTVNKAGMSKWVHVGPICCAESIEEPNITLPRALSKLIKVPVGEKLHLNVPYQGKPKPTITWSKIDLIKKEVAKEVPPPPEPKEGEEPAPPAEPVMEEIIVEEDREWPEYATIRNTHDTTLVHIREAARMDSGIYRLTIKVGDTVVSADIRVAVVDVPSKVRKITIDEVIGNSVCLKWVEPKDDGNTDITGYVVEKRDRKSVQARREQWYICLDKVRHTHCQLTDLVVGNQYQFRIRAFNDVGIGAEAFTKEYADIPRETVEWTRPPLEQINLDCKPEFTTGLNSRNLVLGYNGMITCALRAHPRPKIRWFKNKLEIIDNPKYKMVWGQGVVQLELRRSKLADSGRYKVVAENYLGSDTLEADIVVKDAVERAADGGKVAA